MIPARNATTLSKVSGEPLLFQGADFPKTDVTAALKQRAE